MKTTVILLAILGAYVAYYYYCLTKPLGVRLALPVSLIITMNEYHEDFPNGDYLYCIRADVTGGHRGQEVRELESGSSF